MGPWCSVKSNQKKIVAEIGHSDRLEIYVDPRKISVDSGF